MKKAFFSKKKLFSRKKSYFHHFAWTKARIWIFSFSNVACFSTLNIFSAKNFNFVTSGSDFSLNRKWTSGLSSEFIYQSNQFCLLKRNQYLSWSQMRASSNYWWKSSGRMVKSKNFLLFWICLMKRKRKMKRFDGSARPQKI